jgi:hypothetical protein
MEEIIQEINNKLNKVIDRQNEFELRLKSLETKRNEMYYQKFLEKQLGATHEQTKYGITDISTQDYHIEIKRWNDYKKALGQLLSYNYNKVKKLAVYFFGNVKDEQKTNIMELFQKNDIEIYEFIDTLDGIKINCYDNNKSQDKSNDNNRKFENWLRENIVYKENELIQLKDICQLYLNKSDIHSSLSTKFKNQVEIYVKTNFENLQWKYGVVIINYKQYKGWKHLSLKL